MNDNFRCRIVNESGDVLRINISRDCPAWMYMLNTLCGAYPVEWIGHNSHNKIIQCSPDLKKTISGICTKSAGSLPKAELISRFFNDQPDNIYLAFLREGTLLRIDEDLLHEALGRVLRANYSLIPENGNKNSLQTASGISKSFSLFMFTSGGVSSVRPLGKKYPEDRKNELIKLLRAVDNFDMNVLRDSNHFWRLGELRSFASSEEAMMSDVSGIITGEENRLKDLNDETVVVFGILENADITQLTDLKHVCHHIKAKGTHRDFYDNRMIMDRLLYINGYTRRSFTDIGFDYRIPGRKSVCRFCGRSKKDGAKFKEDPHAISYFFGNKHLLGGGECDSCNSFFGTELEPDFHRYYLPTMNLCGITGRGKNPHAEGENFSSKLGELKLLGHGEDFDLFDRLANGEEVPIDLNDSIPVVKADIYRCLCKYVISLIDDDELPDFSETVRWIKKERTGGYLPKTFRNEKDYGCATTPTLDIYRPINYCESKYGWIAVFRFITNLWVYAVPHVKGCNNNMLTGIIKNFINDFIPEIRFVDEHFNDETLSYVTTHTTQSISEESILTRMSDMSPEEQQEFLDSIPKKWHK